MREDLKNFAPKNTDITKKLTIDHPQKGEMIVGVRRDGIMADERMSGITESKFREMMAANGFTIINEYNTND